jgi:hypothetical protein
MADADFGYVGGALGRVKSLSLAIPQPTDWQHIGNEIDASLIFGWGRTS